MYRIARCFASLPGPQDACPTKPLHTWYVYGALELKWQLGRLNLSWRLVHQGRWQISRVGVSQKKDLLGQPQVQMQSPQQAQSGVGRGGPAEKTQSQPGQAQYRANANVACNLISRHNTLADRLVRIVA